MTSSPFASLHVLVRREDLDPARVAGKVVVVIDILFATSTIVHALAGAVAAIWPARDQAHADALARQRPGALLAGEYGARTLPGCAPATPLALVRRLGDAREVVYCTTNGTRAFAAAAAALEVYAGALTNAAALAGHIAHAHPGRGVLLVCAGSMGRFCLEDFIGAGSLVSRLRAAGDYAASDAAMAAELASIAAAGVPGVLSRSRTGRVLDGLGLDQEIEAAALADSCTVVPVLRDGCLVGAA